MNEESDLQTSGKAVINDVVTLAKDTGTLIYELTMQIVNLIKTAVKNNADKKTRVNKESAIQKTD